MEINVYNQNFKIYIHPSRQKYLFLKDTCNNIALAEQKIIKKQCGYDNEVLIPNVLTIFYIPGLKCNMKCNYCFSEKNTNENTEFRCWIDYIKCYLKKHPYKKINIVFFGGEPSLYLNECILFYNSLNELTNNYDISYSIVTNGYVISKEFIDFCYKTNMSNIQITIDCDKFTHDQNRKDLKGKGTYIQIIQNVKTLLELNFPVTIRTNINNKNVSRLNLLCKTLLNISNNKKIDWSIAPIMSTTETYQFSINVNKVRPYIENICKTLSRKSLHLIPWTSYCDFFGDSVIVLNCDGKVYNCVNLCKHKYNHELIKPLDFLNNNCFSCFWLHLCGSGCKYQNYIKNGDFNSIECLKNIFESLVLPIIEQKAIDYLTCNSNDVIAFEIDF